MIIISLKEPGLSQDLLRELSLNGFWNATGLELIPFSADLNERGEPIRAQINELGCWNFEPEKQVLRAVTKNGLVWMRVGAFNESIELLLAKICHNGKGNIKQIGTLSFWSVARRFSNPFDSCDGTADPMLSPL